MSCHASGICVNAALPNTFLSFFLKDYILSFFFFFGLLLIWQLLSLSIILLITLELTICKVNISMSEFPQYLYPPPGVIAGTTTKNA